VFQPGIGSFRLHLAAEGKAAKTIRTYTEAVAWFAAAHLIRRTSHTRWEQVGGHDVQRWLVRPYVIFYSGVAGADLGFCCLIGPGGDLRSWLRWLRCVEAERDRLAEQLEYAALFRGRC